MRRSRRTWLWTAWTLRDARRRWLQVLSIGLLLAFGVGMYAAMSSMSRWRTDSADASFAALRMHDLRVSLAEGSYARSGTLLRAISRLGDRRAVAGAEERLVVPTQVDASHGGRSILVAGRLVGSPVSGTVDRVHTERGRALRGSDDGQPVAQIDRSFAKHYGLPAEGSIRLAGRRTLRYVGQAEAPEYFIVTMPGAEFGAEASFAAVFLPLASAQAIAGQTGRVNELVLRVRRGTDIGAFKTALARSLRTTLPDTGFRLTRGTTEPAYRLIYKDAEGDQQLMDVFAFLLLGAAVFAAFNLVSRAVEAQRREIGIGMALGVRPRALALRPLLLGVQVALIGVALGIPAGIAANHWLRSVIEAFYPLPVVRTPFQLDVFARGAALGLALPLLATVIPLRRALRVTPVEAIRVGARAAGSSGLAWLVRGLRLPGGAIANLPLRNLLRAPRRTAMTALGIGAVVTIVIALGGAIDSFQVTVDASRDEALAGTPARLTADLAAPQPATSALVRRIERTPEVGASQTSLRLPGTLLAGGHRVDAFVEVIGPGARLWRPRLRSGTLPAGRPGIAIAKIAAQDLHLRVGDMVNVRHPVPTGPRSYQLVDTSLPVTAINASPMRFVAYANPSAAARLRVTGLVNRVSVVPSAGGSADAVKRALLALPAITAVQGAAAASDAVDRAMSQFSEVLYVALAIAAAMALLIAFNAAAISTDERAREHATMLAFGVRAARIGRENVEEAFVTGAFATLIGAGAGYLVLHWTIGSIMRRTAPDLGTLIAVKPITWLAAALAGTVVVALAPLLTSRRVRRTDIPSTLRVVE